MTKHEIESWLAAEAAGDETAAEAAFGAAFARMPRLHPAPGFAERVAWAAAPGTVGAPAWSVWGGRLALAASLAMAGLAAAFLPALRALPFDAPSLAGLLQAGVGVFAWVAERLAAGLAVWEFLARIGSAVSTAAATPQATSALIGSATLSALALYSLNRMLTLERRPR
ncbi:MAG TPA: hypothetical protein VM778_10740 [Gemmatimonadota bacterium]|nr:hypothetical protein [Gemmatimonadota bacterium]